MKLKPKAAAAWLAVPLLAMTMVACGDDDGGDPTDTEAEGGTGDGEPECGNGEIEEGETCDDGDTEDGTNCSATCQLPEPEADCGNETVEEGETCDNGASNGAPGNACTSRCQENECGDGHRGPDEDCDDGDRVDTNACTNECTAPEVPASCGDGTQDEGEDCDNGAENGVPGGDCSSSCLVNECGDGYRGEDEECDDGNLANGDTCSSTCTSPVAPPECGDGNVDEGEDCDEGAANGTRDSECSSICGAVVCGDEEIGAGEQCDNGAQNGLDGNVCTNSCQRNVCGDEHIGPNESCDDGNTEPGDDCNACVSPDCGDGVVQEGEECDGSEGCTDSCQDPECGDGVVTASAGEDCDLGTGNNGNGSPGALCTTECVYNECGDGHVAGPEACDDGNTEDDEECLADCSLPGCGDGVVQGEEACDDGNDVDTDDCTSLCVDARCGDGFIQADEECDDGNANSDSAPNACRVDCSAAACGDSVVDTDEECDLGAQNGIGGVCSSNCNDTRCGDGVVQDDEECDDGNTNNNDSCITTCQWNDCGDGAVYTSETDPLNPNDVEECDDANTSGADSCLNTCEYNVCADAAILTTITEPYADPDATGPMTASRIGRTTGNVLSVGLGECDTVADCANDAFHTNTSGARSFSGVGQVDGANTACTVGEVCFPAPLAAFVVGAQDVEACDDGNLVNTDACVAVNTDGDGALECAAAECGDGLVQAGSEDCDDQNANNNDSCIDDCSWNACQDGWRYTAVSDTANPAAVEACDDGNALATDLCSATCTVVGVTTNTGISASCGDSVIQPGEGCDNGATNSDAPGSTCTTTCRIPTCGNGTVTGTEQCDDGNLDNNDQCLNTCRWNVCGDGFRYTDTAPGLTNSQPLEECDDANTNSNDACTPSCAWNDCGDGAMFASIQSGAQGAGSLTGSLTGLNGPSWAVGGPANAGVAVVNVCDNGGTPPASAQYDDCINQNAIEPCDDGNAINGDGCNSCVLSTCGDTVVDAGEDCDDGNVVSGDGCESDCSLPPVCGDGVTDPGEACDGDDDVFDADGNNLGPLPNGVTCLPDCRLSTCRGTAGAQALELCDDGNTVNSDTCTNLCLQARCGDGILQPNGLDGVAGNGDDEECDDGNDAETDSCTNSCEYNVLGDGIRYTDDTIEASTATLHACDTGDVTAAHPNRANFRADRVATDCSPVVANCDGDGYEDETDFCGAWDDPTPANRGVIRCAPNATARGITTWKNGDWCLMPAETHGDHSNTNSDDLVVADWYDAKAHCESYGLDARLVVVNTVANRTILATTAEAARVAGVVDTDALAGYCEASNDGAPCTVATEVADCDSDTCNALSLSCEGSNDGAACDADADCDSGSCAARYSWVGLFDDFTGNAQGGTPVSTNPGRWYWLDNTLDNPQTTATRELWKHTAGPPQAFTHPNGDGDCGALDQGTNDAVAVGTEGWDDVSCTVERAFMCEFPLP